MIYRTITISCDVCGEDPDIAGDTVGGVRAAARLQGWGRGVLGRGEPVGDLCPSCRAAKP